MTRQTTYAPTYQFTLATIPVIDLTVCVIGRRIKAHYQTSHTVCDSGAVLETHTGRCVECKRLAQGEGVTA